VKLLKSYAVDFQCMLKGNNSVSSLIFKGQVASVIFVFGLVSKARLNVSHVYPHGLRYRTWNFLD
jgi:hypothetical protein